MNQDDYILVAVHKSATGSLPEPSDFMTVGETRDGKALSVPVVSPLLGIVDPSAHYADAASVKEVFDDLARPRVQNPNGSFSYTDV